MFMDTTTMTELSITSPDGEDTSTAYAQRIGHGLYRVESNLWFFPLGCGDIVRADDSLNITEIVQRPHQALVFIDFEIMAWRKEYLVPMLLDNLDRAADRYGWQIEQVDIATVIATMDPRWVEDGSHYHLGDLIKDLLPPADTLMRQYEVEDFSALLRVNYCPCVGTSTALVSCDLHPSTRIVIGPNCTHGTH